MTSLLTAIGLFFFAFLFHLIIWRAQIPRRQTRTLVMIFMFVPVLVACTLCLGRLCGSLWCPPLRDLPSIGLFYLGAAGCYLITYAGVEELSPSLLIIRTLEAASNRGCTRLDLAKVLTSDRFVEPRLRALRLQHIITDTPNGSRLTTQGIRIARFAIFLSRCFCLNEGG